MTPRDLVARFGEPEAIHRPSPGQTVAGVTLGVLAAGLLFAVAIFGCNFDMTNRVCAGLLGLGAVAFTIWVSRQSRWQLALYPGGLAQFRTDGVDALAWSEVREVIQTRYRGFGEPTIRVKIVGTGVSFVVNPPNYRGRDKLFAALLAKAQEHGRPIRVEWEEPSD